MAGGGVEVEVVKLLEIADALERGRAEGAFAIEDMEDDAFKEVAEREVVILGEGFEYFKDALFHPDAGLDSFDLQLVLCNGRSFHTYLCTRVGWYRQWGGEAFYYRGPRRTVRRRGNRRLGARFPHDDDW